MGVSGKCLRKCAPAVIAQFFNVAWGFAFIRWREAEYHISTIHILSDEIYQDHESPVFRRDRPKANNFGIRRIARNPRCTIEYVLILILDMSPRRPYTYM